MNRFQCPRCKGALRAAAAGQVACTACGAGYDAANGVLDLASSPTAAPHGPALDPAATALDRIAQMAGERWPESLGSVLQIGGGGLSRALIAGGQVQELAIIDPSVASLNDERTAIEQAGLSGRMPLAFAACPPGAALRDVAFDTCISLTALERRDDPRRLLAELFRCLRPGGRAILLAANRRYFRALGATLADIVALQFAVAPAPNADRNKLVEQLAHMRLTDLHQDVTGEESGDAPRGEQERATLIEADAMTEVALLHGFDTAEALPFEPDADGTAMAAAMLQAQAAGPDYTAGTLALLPGFRRRYFDLLHPADRSAATLLWLTKPVGPRLRTFRAPAPVRPPSVMPGHELASLAGGLPVRCWLDLLAGPSPHGLTLTIVGWCLANTDIIAVRVTIDGMARDAPVRLARPDVHQTLNGSGLYPAWNALCSGVDSTLAYEGLYPAGSAPTLAVQLILANGCVAQVPCAERLPLGEAVRVVA
jgi:SAM-dependent methyltransferase